MNRDDEMFGEIRHRRESFKAVPTQKYSGPRSHEPNEDAAIAAIAHSEGWLIPPAEVTRVTLRPWQQAVFWGLRVYIVIMLIIMGYGFVHATGG